jgi:hypothetical protein
MDKSKTLIEKDGGAVLLEQLSPLFTGAVTMTRTPSTAVTLNTRNSQGVSEAERYAKPADAVTATTNRKHAVDPVYVEYFLKLAQNLASGFQGKLDRAKEELFPSTSVATLESTSAGLHGFVNAVVLVRPVATEWIQACGHISRIVHTERIMQAEIAEVAVSLFNQGLRLARLMNTIILIDRPFALNERCSLEMIEKLLSSVTDIMTHLANDLPHEKGVIDYLAKISVARTRSQNKQAQSFFLPSKKQLAPGQAKPERAIDTSNLMRSGADKWLRVEDHQMYSEQDVEVSQAAQEEYTKVVGRTEVAVGMDADDVLHLKDIQADEELLDAAGPAQKHDNKPDTRQTAGSGSRSKAAKTNPGPTAQAKLTHAGSKKNIEGAPDVNANTNLSDLGGQFEKCLEAQQGIKVKVDIPINTAAIREQLEKANIQELYKNVQSQRRRDAKPVADPIACRLEAGDKTKRWTYQCLVECKPVAVAIQQVLHILRKSISTFFQTAKHPYQFEFFICVDNSGSMGSKEHSVIEALVVLIEVLRKLEFRFAIALWGRNPGKLLLDFEREGEEHFNLKKGQEIIQSLTFDEPSEIATCLKALCNKVWPSDVEKPDHTQRLLITLFDGFSHERNAQDFVDMRRDHKCMLGMLLIDNQHLADHVTFLQSICTPGCHSIVNVRNLDQLSKQVLTLFMNMFERSKKECETLSGGGVMRTEVLAARKEDLAGKASLADIDLFVLTGKDALDDENKRGVGGEKTSFSISSHDAAVPMLQQARLDEELVRMVNNSEWLQLNEVLQQNEDFHRGLEQDGRMSMLGPKVQEYWDKTVRELSPQIEEFVSVLEEFAMPFNKFTRRRCALKGSSLHLPG